MNSNLTDDLHVQVKITKLLWTIKVYLMPPPKVNNIRKTIKKKKSILHLNKSFWRRVFALAVSMPSQVPVAHSEGHTFVSHHLP